MSAIVYELEVRHAGLNKYRHIRGRDKYVVEQKARAQLAQWEDQWRVICERNSIKAGKDERKAEAARRTSEAQGQLKTIDEILLATLSVNDAVDWSALKDVTKFSVSRPRKPAEASLPPEPSKDDSSFVAQLNFIDRFFSSRRERKIAAANERYQQAFVAWKKNLESVNAQNALAAKVSSEALEKWGRQKDEFEADQAKKNAALDTLRTSYEAGDPNAIEEYCDLVLSNSRYPEWCPRNFELAYNGDNRMLVLDFDLPIPEDIPTLKQVKYIATRDDHEEVHLKEAEIGRIYDKLVYDICLRTIHELFESDVANYLDAISFNGWVNFINKATGNPTRSCIVSVQTTKEKFEGINLSSVESKACFKSLKGVGSSKLHALAAVAPLLQLNRYDDRFVQAMSVGENLEEGVNIATMDWQEFEHLVREIFEMEFAGSGGEVKVTRASRDRGVDAIAFDPDPLRGGKIVIQAKRYTHTVDVSAVRDLYGTVMNEGATKGILVTTSSFGPDAYEFAKDKPITLLDGGNLLFLMEKHGHKVRIDLAEARTLLARE